MSSDDPPNVTRTSNALGRIAEALGCPVATLYGEETLLASVSQAAELIQLWFAIEAQEGRDRILALARAIAAGRDGEASPQARR